MSQFPIDRRKPHFMHIAASLPGGPWKVAGMFVRKGTIGYFYACFFKQTGVLFCNLRTIEFKTVGNASARTLAQ
jgi:hypothetical protein